MSNKLRFVWIDDDNRKKDALNLERLLSIKCEFINVKPKDVDYLSKINEVKPDLILVDHNLVNIGDGKNMKKGSSVAALIKEKHPDYAVACVTAQNINEIDSQQRLLYEEIFSYDDIKSHYETMKAIGASHKKLKLKPPKKNSDLFALMKAPHEEYIRLEAVLPYEIKENYKDFGISANISTWIRHTLMNRPGFLYDRLWAATLLGVNEKGFEKIEGLFKPAKYKGLFADRSNERWWKSGLLNVLAKLVKRPGLPWEKGREIPGINSRNFSKDFYTDFKEDYPEVVAYIDETSNQREQMKLTYTVPHPRYDKLLYFDEIRMMKT